MPPPYILKRSGLARFEDLRLVPNSRSELGIISANEASSRFEASDGMAVRFEK
jgi:hypothetical protein